MSEREPVMRDGFRSVDDQRTGVRGGWRPPAGVVPVLRTALCALVVGGCAHAPDPGLRAQLAKPAIAGDVDEGNETFAGVDGVKLHGRWWRPRGAIRGVVVVQHGLNDHGDRYSHLAGTLVARGMPCTRWTRGHGRSAGKRVTVDRFQYFLDDEATWIAKVRARESGKPLFLFGHSMGGVIMALHAEARSGEIAGVVLSAPALGIDAPPLQLAALTLIAQLGAPGSMLRQRDADFTRDPAVVAEMGPRSATHPLLTDRPTPQWSSSMGSASPG
jgi:alpha-beta hydrolase superfamily lysophospholipase